MSLPRMPITPINSCSSHPPSVRGWSRVLLLLLLSWYGPCWEFQNLTQIQIKWCIWSWDQALRQYRIVTDFVLRLIYLTTHFIRIVDWHLTISEQDSIHQSIPDNAMCLSSWVSSCQVTIDNVVGGLGSLLLTPVTGYSLSLVSNWQIIASPAGRTAWGIQSFLKCAQ